MKLLILELKPRSMDDEFIPRASIINRFSNMDKATDVAKGLLRTDPSLTAVEIYNAKELIQIVTYFKKKEQNKN